MPSNSFRFNNKRAFLTFPQCALSKEQLRDVLLDRTFGTRSVVDWLISHEEHADGSPHLHALLIFDAPFNSVNVACFDVDGHHPNIQGARSAKNVITYIKKDGDWIGSPGIDLLVGRQATQERWLGAVNATSRDNFLEIIRTEFPDKFILFNSRIYEYADRHFAPPIVEYVNPYTDFNTPPLIDDWVTSNVTYV